MNRVLTVVVSALCASASQYDPHLPEGSPWFEGWYTRISETSSGHSIGIIVGHYPKDKATLKDPSVYVALIVDDGAGSAKTYEAYPEEAAVLANGATVTKNPDLEADPNFSFSVPDMVDIVQGGTTHTVKLNFAAENVIFEATLTEPETWGERGESPEGWAGKLPFLGLHWFVYSLHSKAVFKLSTPTLGTISGSGRAHQEKNWGTAFPSSWIWAEAVGSSGSRIALAGGPAPVGPVTVPDLYLLGYRSEKLHWNFHPQDPALYHPTIDACTGSFELQAASADRLLKIVVKADPKSTEGLFKVAGPTRTGFKTDSVESYRANVTVEAYSGVLHNHLEEKASFSMAALEFGGEYRCPSLTRNAAVAQVAEPGLLPPIAV